MHRDNGDRYEVQLAPSLAGQKRLGSYLVDAGLINRGQIDVALNDQQATGMRFGEILVARGWIKQQTVEYFMEKIVLPERRAQSSVRSNGTPADGGEVRAEPTRPQSTSRVAYEDSGAIALGSGSISNHTPSRSTGMPAAGTVDEYPTVRQEYPTVPQTTDTDGKVKKRKTPPITKRLPSNASDNDGVPWVG